MQLYKSRGFSDFFQDTFSFLKLNGKHFFKHYFITNGIFLILLLVIGYFFTQFYSDFIFSGLSNQQNPGALDGYMNENLPMFIILVILFCIVGLISGIISYSYTPIYLQLYNTHGSKNFETKTIITSYKHNIGKLLTFIVCGILMSIPLLIVFFICAFVLIITIIGFLALPLLIGAFALFYYMALSEYLENKKGIWDCFGYAWALLTSKFWAAVGCVGIFYLISYALQYIIQLITSIFTMGSLFINPTSGTVNPTDVTSTMSVFMIVTFFLSFVLSTILGSILLLNQGIVFYSLKEDKEHINTKDIIDQIGAGA